MEAKQEAIRIELPFCTLCKSKARLWALWKPSFIPSSLFRASFTNHFPYFSLWYKNTKLKIKNAIITENALE